MDHQITGKTEFNDLKLVDQYIPLEDVYVENLYPFSNTYTVNNQQYHYYQPETYINSHTNYQNQSYHSYEDFKENNHHTGNNLTYSNNNYSSYYTTDYGDYQRYGGAYTTGYYTNPTVPNLKIENNHYLNDHHQQETVCYSTPMLEMNSVGGKKETIGEKPPEPYANIIVKAILSTNNNVMQLKDIYSYMIENYEYFLSQKQSTKWKNSVRHNLSRHKYFVKTCEKNAQGHYWSIDQAYLAIFKKGDFDEKSIKRAKLNSKLKSKASTIRVKKQTKKIIPNTSDYDLSGFSYTTVTNSSSSVINSPTISCKSFNTAFNPGFNSTMNDSAYFEYPSSSNTHLYGMDDGKSSKKDYSDK